MIRRYPEVAVANSTPFVLGLSLLAVAACAVKTQGLGTLDEDAIHASAGGSGGRGGSTPATGGGGRSIEDAPVDDAANDAVPARSNDGRVDERVAPAGGSGGNGAGGTTPGEDAGRDFAWGTGGAAGTGGTRVFDSAQGGAGADGSGDAVVAATADARVDEEPSRDAADDERPDLLPEAVPDLSSAADEPLPDVPGGLGDTHTSDDEGPGEAGSSLTLVWSDEFDGLANTPVDVARWTQVTWAPGSVNNEVQQYTAGVKNVFHDGNGCLVIRALHNLASNSYSYTSGRIDTSGKVSFGPGHRIEVRAKLPSGIGSFPGIVMMGTGGGTWPASGELALMEQYGQDKSWFYATAYAPNTVGSGVTPKTKYNFADALTASADFHVYSLDWYSDHLVFQVDGNLVLTSSYGSGSPFYSITEYIVLDLALGGDMGGAIDDSAFPMEMLVDYVRVYQF